MSTLALVVAAAVGLAQPAAPSASPLPDVARKLPSRWSQPESAPVVQAPGQPPAAEMDKWVDAFPHVRVNRAQKTVEFDGVVAWDFHDADAPRTELELLVCLPMRDKEHESLVLSKAKGAHVHAALLMVGLEPGAPGRIEFGAADEKDPEPGVKRVAPQGPEVAVEFVYTKSGKEVTDDARSWVRDEAGWREDKERRAATAERITERLNRERAAKGDKRVVTHVDVDPISGPTLTFVFGGSKVGQMRNEQGDKVNVYNADELGTLIGLCTFGSETIGLTRVYSPDSGLDAPSFIAKNEAIPPMDTPVRVRVKPKLLTVINEEEEKAFPGLGDALRQGQ